MVTITDGSGSRIKVPGLGGFDGVFKRLSKNAPGELESLFALPGCRREQEHLGVFNYRAFNLTEAVLCGGEILAYGAQHTGKVLDVQARAVCPVFFSAASLISRSISAYFRVRCGTMPSIRSMSIS
jgi:hypothetical protein